MKRAAVLWLVLAGTAVPSQAAKRVSGEQLEQGVANFHLRQDRALAFQIAEMQLTERLSAARLARLSTSLPGDRSREALTAIADAAEFQPPPPDEIPAAGTPDLAAQRRIMGLVADYVSKTIPQLPNFIATRVTQRFEDTPLLQKSADAATPYQPLHLVSNSQVTILYRDGREMEDRPTAGTKTTSVGGLETWGEFGPILATVLLDAAQNKLAWNRWEQGRAGLTAIFSYEVPKERSHYQINYCCVAEESATVVANVHPFRRIAGYRGEIVVDPASGTILRLMLKVALKPGEPVSEANILVDYGPVEIGGKTYFCPVKGVSLTTAQMVQQSGIYKDPLARQLQPLKTMLNEVRFEQYHMFRAESRVLTAEDSASGDATPESAKPNPISSERPLVENEPMTAIEPRSEAPVAGNNEENAGTSLLVSEPEISISNSAAVPDALPASPVHSSGFRMRTTSKLVDISVVAYDQKGHPVTNLKLSDFAIYDNGRRQDIKYFGQAGQSASSPSPASEQSPEATAKPVFSNRQIGPAMGQPAAQQEQHASILMIDASNLAWNDLSYARQDILRFLKTVPADEPAGLYILRSYGFEILLEPTSNHSLVAAELSQWMPTAQDLSRAQDEEQRNRQNFDWVHSVADWNG